MSYSNILGEARLPILNRSGSPLANPQQIQSFLFDNLSLLQAPRERRRLDVLGAYKDNWDGRGSAAPNYLNIYAAKAWISEISKGVTSLRPWMHPHISLSEEGEVIYEWWRGEKKITLYVSSNQVIYIISWGINIDTGMEDGVLKKASEFSSLWNWLFL